MDKRILFSIDRGSFAEGFDVTLQALQEGQTYLSVTGKLPEDAQLGELYQTFRDMYFRQKNIRIVVPPEQVTHPQGCLNHASELNMRFQIWLDRLTFKVQNGLVCALKDLGSTQLILQIQEEVNAPDADILAKLPWHTWHFFEDNKVHPEVTLGRLSAPIKRQRFGKMVKILAIIGHSEGIDTHRDLQELRQIIGASVTALEQPSRLQLTEKLWQQRWDILFFAGHSNSEGATGRIYINETESLTLQEVKVSLKQAVNRGLKLAIFNSCDGLGLVSELRDSGVPWIIVMREPVPDRIAQLFLKYFLESFSQGQSFLLAVQNARHQLEGIQNEFPCATWLPVACQNLEAIPLVWPQWATLPNRYITWANRSKRSDKDESSKEEINTDKRKWTNVIRKILFFLCLMVLGLALAIIFNYVFTPVETCHKTPISINCGQGRNFPSYSLIGVRENNLKISGIKKLFEKDYGGATNFLEEAWDKEKDPSTLIALNNAKILRDIKGGNLDQNNVFTIAISNSFEDNPPQEIGGSILFGVAWKQKEFNNPENPYKLFVILGNDRNSKEEAVILEKELAKNKEILGVIGPYSSSVTFYVIDKYRKDNLPLISPTSTANLDSFNDGNQKYRDFSWFFRPVSTTDTATKDLTRYLKKMGYNKVKIFYQDKDLFAKSFYLNFKIQLLAQNISTTDLGTLFADSPEMIEPEINKLKNNYSKENTALIILADAYGEQSIGSKHKIIEENNGAFFVAGNNTIFESKLLELLPNNKKALHNMIISIPWHPSQKNREELGKFVKIKPSKNLKSWSVNDPQLTWHLAMSYDATQMLIEAILEQKNKYPDRKPTRQGIQEALSNPGFRTEGLTGTITLNKSDRKVQTSALIRPDCSSNPCSWVEVN